MNFQFQTFFNATISSCNCLIFNGPTDFDFENCELNMGKCLNQGYIIRAPIIDSLRMNFPVPKITSLTYRKKILFKKKIISDHQFCFQVGKSSNPSIAMINLFTS